MHKCTEYSPQLIQASVTSGKGNKKWNNNNKNYLLSFGLCVSLGWRETLARILDENAQRGRVLSESWLIDQTKPGMAKPAALDRVLEGREWTLHDRGTQDPQDAQSCGDVFLKLCLILISCWMRIEEIFNMISPNQCARAPISLDSVEMIDSHLPCYLPPDAVSAVNHTMPYDMHGGEHREAAP